MLEELPPDILIGNLVVDAGLPEDFLNDSVNPVQFSILHQPNTRQDLFEVEQATGVIKTTTKIDRDTLCPSQESCHVLLHVAARSGYHFKIVKVLINIFLGIRLFGGLIVNYNEIPLRIS